MRVLFICTHNRCRSIMAEAIGNQSAGGKLVARSAGSQPEGQVHPGALAALERAGYVSDGLHSKSWDELQDFHPDLIVTLCDSAANEPCPAWFGGCEVVHYSLADPSRVVGDDVAVAEAFDRTIGELEELVGSWNR
jgi:arsenate reductase